MPTNLHIDDALLARAKTLGGHATKRETVDAALKAYVQRLRQLGVLAMEGTVEYDARYDHKKMRRRR